MSSDSEDGGERVAAERKPWLRRDVVMELRRCGQ
jgi:hypothetical protein